MSRLIESIKLLDGRFFNLFYHEQRMFRSLHALFGINHPVDIQKYLREIECPQTGLYKCRIVYDHRSREVSFSAYEPKRINKIKIVEDDQISYEFKFLDRHLIDRLFQQRGGCDDVLMAKRGCVTDCSFSNIVFRKGSEWFTPRTALLKGTMRQKLIDENRIQAREIQVQDIRSYETCKIINAMVEFDGPEIDVTDIVF